MQMSGKNAESAEGREASRWRSLLPVVLLITIATTQILLAKTAALSPWKGGGFGMFASTDGTASRRVRIFVEADDRAEEIEVPASLEADGTRMALFPSQGRLRGFAEAVAARERRKGRPVTSVRVEVWSTRFDDEPLRAIEAPLRSLRHHVQ